MQPQRYEFSTIFNYDQINGVLIPKFNIVINGVRYSAWTPISRTTLFSGLNLFNYINRPMQAVWDPTNFVLTVEGFL